MAEPTFRWARNCDHEQILAIVARAFGMQPGSTKWEQAARLIRGETGRFRVMVEGEEIVATAYLCRLPIQIGSSIVDIGYVGQVSVRPESQRKGLGSRLLGDLCACLEQGGYDLARLSGLVRYYERFGWTPFPRRFIEFPLRNLKAGATEMSVSELVHPDPNMSGRVRNYRSETDRARRDDLVRRFNHRRTGASPRLVPGRRYSPLHHEDPRRWRLVYEKDGEIRGYVATHVFPDDVSDFESAVNLYQLAFDLRDPEAVVGLMKHVLWAARKRGAHRVTARLPWDRRLLAILRRAGLVFEQVELMNAATGNMLRIVDFRRLLEKITPELTDRWRGSDRPTPCALRIAAGSQSATLLLDPEGVRVTDRSGPFRRELTMDQHQFLRALLGLNPVETLLEPDSCDDETLRLAGILFPPQACATTNWG